MNKLDRALAFGKLSVSSKNVEPQSFYWSLLGKFLVIFIQNMMCNVLWGIAQVLHEQIKLSLQNINSWYFEQIDLSNIQIFSK